MRHLRSTPVLLIVLAALPAALLPARAGAFAQADDTAASMPAAAGDEATRAFEPLRRMFATLHRSLRTSGGMMDSDRSSVEGFLAGIDAFRATWPDHAAATATALQLARWLDEHERIGPLYERLGDLLPADAAIAMSWLSYREGRPDADPEDISAAYEALFARFPDEERILTGWTKRLMDQARYDDVLAILERRELDPEEMPEAVFRLGDALFAQHRFEEALAALESISPSARVEPRVRSSISRAIPYCRDYLELWPLEQDRRRAEAEADDLPRVEIVTEKGLIVVELFENEAPNTVANFISLVESGFYEQTSFHRFEPDFMIQGGDPNSKPGATGTAGQGDPGYYIPDEHLGDDHRLHFGDSLSMAKRTDPNTAGCQFYFNHRPSPWLNGKHTVFGRVVTGLEVVRSLRRDDRIVLARVSRKRDHEYEPSTLPK